MFENRNPNLISLIKHYTTSRCRDDGLGKKDLLWNIHWAAVWGLCTKRKNNDCDNLPSFWTDLAESESGRNPLKSLRQGCWPGAGRWTIMGQGGRFGHRWLDSWGLVRSLKTDHLKEPCCLYMVSNCSAIYIMWRSNYIVLHVFVSPSLLSTFGLEGGNKLLKVFGM